MRQLAKKSQLELDEMARLSDLTFKYRLFMKTYRYRRYDWKPGAALTKPLSESCVAVVTTAALYRPDQPSFDESIKGGDPSYREIPNDTELTSLLEGHRSAAFDHTGVERDKNLALPLDRLRELESAGLIGSASPRHFSLMGSVTAPGRLISRSAPEVASHLLADGVDAVLLTPVWPMCNQSVGLVQSVIEKHGIPTTSISLLREVSEQVRPPRTLFVDLPLGYPLGRPHDAEMQSEILMAALRLLESDQPLPIMEEFQVPAFTET